MLALGACGSDRAARQWDRDYLDAVARAQPSAGGDVRTAQSQILALAERAPSENARREALLEYALVARAHRQWGEALARFERVWREPAKDSSGGRALYEFGRIELEQFGREEAGRASLWRVLREFPDTVGAEFALQLLDERARNEARQREGAAAQLEALHGWASALDALARELKGREVARAVLMRLAEIQGADLGDADAALDSYRRVVGECSDCATADNARWQMALLHRQAGRFGEAAEELEWLAGQRETSWFVGTYNSGWAQDARYALATMYLEDVGDLEGAASQFERFVRDYGDSARADDALWQLAELWGKAGRPETQREALERLLAKYPESRHVRRAGEQLKALP